jgi:hypothetical protein
MNRFSRASSADLTGSGTTRRRHHPCNDRPWPGPKATRGAVPMPTSAAVTPAKKRTERRCCSAMPRLYLKQL